MSEEKCFTSVCAENFIFEVPENIRKHAQIKSMEEYEKLYRHSLDDPSEFWGKMAEESVEWFEKWDKVLDYDFLNDLKIEWYKNGKLNVSYNCLDRHIKTWRKNKAAIIWQGESSEESRIYTYQELYHEVCKFANVLKKNGVKKGDRVCIYLPMIPQVVISMLACARIGAIHVVVFGGFSADSLRDKIVDSTPKILITCDFSPRAGKNIKLKQNADKTLSNMSGISKVIVIKRTGMDVDMQPGRDVWWHEEMAAKDISASCEPERMDAEDPLFILYTSGSTGKPKGILHTTGGYLVYTATTFKYIFDYKEEETYWCTADIGWITGHSYTVYGPLCNGATSLMFEGAPSYPKPDRFWEIVEKYQVNILYTAPTAIRTIAREGDEWPKRRDLSSLRILGSVGEQINPEAWMWYHEVIGGSRCPILDTWWQTETGGICISPLPGAWPLKPGSVTLPFFGIEPDVLREDGSKAQVDEGGYLVIKKPWPGMMRTVFGQPERFKETYFSQFPGYYFTGDSSRIDSNGYFWILGRIDDVINVSGHRIGIAEIESAMFTHPRVAEAAVVAMPHDIKGQGIHAFIVLKPGAPRTEELKNEIIEHVKNEIGSIAAPDVIQFTAALPKTRSGKIMRRILRKIASGDTELGDTTALADQSVINMLIEGSEK